MRTRFLSSLAVALSGALLSGQWGPTQPQSPPSPRSDALLAFDLLNTRMLLFGGNNTDDFWALAGGAWTQLNPAVLPPARRRAAMVANPFTGEILLYGGQGGGQTALDDVWAWDGFGWQQRNPMLTPGGMMWHGMAFDTQRQLLVAYGGRRNIFNPQEYLAETWEYSSMNDQWSVALPQQSPPPLLQPAMCFHPALGQTILFGGEDDTGQGLDQTWTFDGTTWTEINTSGVRPPPRAGGKLVPIINRGIVVLVGGRDPFTFEIVNDTWEHDGAQWRQITNVYGGIYPARHELAIAHDFNLDRIVAFGGKIANNGVRDDTWEYGAHWQPFGMGCPGTAGTPTFTGTVLPRLGQTATAEVGNVPPAIPFAFVAVGLSRTQWALGALPALLTPFGMDNCRTYTSADLLAYAPASNGVATWTWAVPNNPTIVGFPFHLQGVTFDPGANPGGLAVSRAATMVIGW